LLGPEGVPVDETVTPELLLSSDFAVTRELVRCAECSHRATLDDARVASNLPTTNVLWEDTDLNIKKPIVCPKCGNAEHFAREVVRAVQESELIKIEECKATVVDRGGDPEILDEVRRRYLCVMADCGGEVVLHTEDYVLTKDV